MNVIERLFETIERNSTSIAIYVPTPRTSIQLQNYLFTLGYHWMRGKNPYYTSSNYIHVYKDHFSLSHSHTSNVSTHDIIIPYYKIIPSLKKLC